MCAPCSPQEGCVEGRQTGANDLRKEFNLPFSSRHVQRLLSRQPYLSFQNIIVSPVLPENHNRIRVEWARKHVNLARTDWKEIVFFDMKKLNLDRRDGFKYY